MLLLIAEYTWHRNESSYRLCYSCLFLNTYLPNWYWKCHHQLHWKGLSVRKPACCPGIAGQCVRMRDFQTCTNWGKASWIVKNLGRGQIFPREYEDMLYNRSGSWNWMNRLTLPLESCNIRTIPSMPPLGVSNATQHVLPAVTHSKQWEESVKPVNAVNGIII